VAYWLDPDLFGVVDQGFHVLLVGRIIDGLRQLPAVALLLEDDFALAGVLDLDLRDLVGIVGGKLDFRKRRARRRERVRHRVVLGPFLREPKRPEKHDEYPACCVDLLFRLHGHRMLSWGGSQPPAWWVNRA